MNYYTTGKIYEKGEVTGGTSQNGNAWARMTLVLDVALGKYSKKLAFQVMTSNIDAVQAFNLGDKVEVAWDLASREYTNKDGVRSWFTQAELHSIKAAGMPENVVDMGAGVDSAMNAQPAAAPAPTADEQDLPF
jgi:hypothetical protein